jgi:hypothetical protein
MLAPPLDRDGSEAVVSRAGADDPASWSQMSREGGA